MHCHLPFVMTATRAKKLPSTREEKEVEKALSEEEEDVVGFDELDILKLFTNPDGSWYHPCIVVLGNRGSGKSRKVKSLCHEMRDHFGTIYRFSPTADTPNEQGELVYEGLFAKSFCWGEASDKDLANIIEFQTLITQGEPLEGITEKDKRCLILLDDMSSERGVTHGKALKKLFANARNLRASVMMTAQHYAHIPKDGRKNCDVMIMNYEDDENLLKVMRKEKFTNFKTEDDFKDAMVECCKDWGSICWVGSRVPRDKNNPFNNIFSYTAKKNMGIFRMTTRIPDIIDEIFLKSQDQLKAALQARMATMIRERMGVDINGNDGEGSDKPENDEDDDSDEDDSDDDEMPKAVSRHQSEDEKSDRGEGQARGNRRVTRSSVSRGRGGVLKFHKR